MPKLRPDAERSYFRFPVSLLSMVDGADLRPDPDPDSDGRRLGRCIIAHTLFEKGKAQALRLAEEHIELFPESQGTAEALGMSAGFMAADWLQQHKPQTLPEGLMVDDWPKMVPERAAVALALAPGRNFADASSPRPLPNTVSEGGRLGGLGIKAGPLPAFHVLRSAYWEAAAHVEHVAEVTGGRSMEATVRADFVRELAAGTMPLREFRILAAITAKLGGDRPFVQVTDAHLAALASGYRSEKAFGAALADFEDRAARELAFRESDEFKAWPEADRLAALASVAESEPEPEPRILFTVDQIRHTRKQLCAPRGVFVGYLYNRRKLYLAHPAKLDRYAREKGDDPALTLARLVEAKHDRRDERKHAAHAAAAIAKAERTVAAATRERDLAERLRRIADAAAVPPSSAERSTPARESFAERPASVPPYIEAPSEKQQQQNHHQEKQQHEKRRRTAADGTAAAARGMTTMGIAEDRGPANAVPVPGSPEALFGTPAIVASASPRLASEGNGVRETDPTPEPDPPGGGSPLPVPVPEAVAPVPIHAAHRALDGGGGAAAPVPPVEARPVHPPAGALSGTDAHKCALAARDPGPIYGPGGCFRQVLTADNRAWYVLRDAREVAAERARLDVERWRRDAGHPPAAGTGA